MNMKDWMRAHGKKAYFTKGTYIVQLGERPTHFYLLEDGWVKIGQEAVDGEMITLSLRKTGELFGLAEILAHAQTRSRSAYCLTDTIVYTVSTEQLFARLEEAPVLWEEFCRIMAERLIETQHFIRALTTLPAPQRLGWFLQQFATQHGSIYMVELPLTHEEISYLIGCSRQKVTSYLNAWRKEGAVTYARGRIEILDRAAIFPVL